MKCTLGVHPRTGSGVAGQSDMGLRVFSMLQSETGGTSLERKAWVS